MFTIEPRLLPRTTGKTGNYWAILDDKGNLVKTFVEEYNAEEWVKKQTEKLTVKGDTGVFG